MNWIQTPESSNIVQFAYDKDSSVLFVEFKKGGVYQYLDVPVVIFDAMKVAASKGQYLAQNVKGVFRYARA